MKKRFLTMLLCGILTLGVVGCGNDTEFYEENKDNDTVKGNCVVTECMKQIEISNTVEEINNIIGFEPTKSEYSEEQTWKLDDKNWITLKYAGESPILQATIDKETIKDEDIELLSASELKEKLNNGSFTYEELVTMLGNKEGILNSKTEGSVGYIWVDKNNRTLGATFNNKSGKCTVASIR